MRVLVIHGPNLNLLGEREPEIYGSKSLADIDAEIARTAHALGIEVTCAQYSSEGDIVDALHAARTGADVVLLNPGAYTHYSHAIADAVAAIRVPVIEVHLSNIAAREEFRAHSVVARVARGTVAGFGADSYVAALHIAAKIPIK